MNDAISKLEGRLDGFIDNILTTNAGDGIHKVESLCVSKEIFKYFLRYSLLVNTELSAQRQKEMWTVFSSGLETGEGEIPLGAMYKGLFIYTDTMENVRTGDQMQKVVYYKKTGIATIKSVESESSIAV